MNNIDTKLLNSKNLLMSIEKKADLDKIWTKFGRFYSLKALYAVVFRTSLLWWNIFKFLRLEQSSNGRLKALKTLKLPFLYSWTSAIAWTAANANVIPETIGFIFITSC